MQKLPLLRFATVACFSGVPLILSCFCLEALSDELKGHVQSSSTARITRPPAKDDVAEAASTSTAREKPLNAQLDDGTFDLNARSSRTNLDLSDWNPWGSGSSNSLRGFNRLAAHRPVYRPAGIAQTVLTGEDDDLSQTEMRWRGSTSQFDTGCSRLHVSANIAFCPPRDPVMREDWRTLMRELQNEATATMWRQWQDNVCEQLMRSRKLDPMTYGNMSMHITIKNNGEVTVNGAPFGPMNNEFADSCRTSVNQLKTTGWLVLPPASAVHQAHLRVTIMVRPANMP